MTLCSRTDCSNDAITPASPNGENYEGLCQPHWEDTMRRHIERMTANKRPDECINLLIRQVYMLQRAAQRCQAR